MSTMTITERLTITHCGVCQVRFAMPESMWERCHERGDWFWCPNGHKIHYTDSENAQLERERAALQRRLESARQDVATEQSRRQHAEHRARAFKGVATKVRKRAAHGVCPAPGCKRSFANVARHVERMHPDFIGETDIQHAELQDGA